MGDNVLTGDVSSIAESDDVLYEVVNGKRVELPPMSAFDTFLATVFSFHLYGFATAKKLGRVATETLFRFEILGDEERRPDIAFVSYHRWPREKRVPRKAAWDVVPDLAIEVVSPSNTVDEVQGKIHEYFRAGVERVWVVHPSTEEIYVYSSPTQPRVLTRADTLEGDTLLPGFQLPVRVLFDEGTEPGS